MPDKILNLILELKHKCKIDENISNNTNLTCREINLIEILNKENKLTFSDLARKIDLSISRTSRIANKLVNKGIINSKEDDIDRRNTYLKLTDNGCKILDQVLKEKLKCEKLITEKLNEEDIREIKKSFIKLLSVL
jgi:DNA-binding MarR family transcriptional regulator